MNMGWSLPPGVTGAMIERAYGYEEPESIRCRCGAFLPARADSREDVEDWLDCDGTVRREEVPYDAVTAEILGPGTVTFVWSDCGPDRGPHEPHREIMWADTLELRRCRRCGTVDKR